MIGLVRSELLKLRTTRTALALIVGMVGLILLVTLVQGLASDEAFLIQRKNQFQLLANGSIATAFAAILGLLSMTTEFRHGTIRSTLLAAPKRTQVLVAKLAATTLFGIALGVFGILLSFGIGRLCLNARDIPYVVAGGDLRLAIGGAIVASALWGALGVGLGAAFRNQVGSIVGLLIWFLFVENILFGLVPSVGRWLPGQASSVLTQIETPHQLPVITGVLLFCGYVVLSTIAGAVVTERRDVS